jgi:glycogen synthase
MDILTLTNEYPPNIYGGAGVHVDYLMRELEGCDNGRHRLQVLCFGDQREVLPGRAVRGIAAAEFPAGDSLRHPKLLDPLYRNVVMAGWAESADIVHCHTWYTHLAGCLLKQLLGIPLVVTTHSLEPQRPWKKEQLGNGYYAAGWLERTALINADGIIAVSGAMRAEILRLFDVDPAKVRVIHNGIDVDQYRPTRNASVLRDYGIDPRRPFLLFVGRVSRQKGIVHLLDAMVHVKTDFQMVLCAASPDTAALSGEVNAAVAAVRKKTGLSVIWIREMVPADRLIALYSHAAAFVCPSVYEPFGIINLEAMACGTPVIASAVGGIPEVVVHGETGLLVAFEPGGRGDAEPQDPRRFARDLAAAVDALMGSPEKRRAMGAAARTRVEKHFNWSGIARRTLEYYAELTAGFQAGLQGEGEGYTR